jgi:hypothetical protein
LPKTETLANMVRDEELVDVNSMPASTAAFGLPRRVLQPERVLRERG